MQLLIGEDVATVHLRKKEELRVRAGHLWIFSNETAEVLHKEGALLANCFSAAGEFLGSAFYSPHSLISCRLLDRNLRAEQLCVAWLQQRLRTAIDLRQKLFPNENCVRWVFGESDGLPGIIIDRYDDTAVLQTFCVAADALLPLLAETLVDNFGIETVIERNESIARQHEELQQRRSLLRGTQPSISEIKELGIRYLVDLWAGQKTGYFLDQKMNRWIARQISAGVEALDCYSNVGGFSLNAIRGGAARVIAVDSSRDVLDLAERSAQLNGWRDRIGTVKTDVFEFLQEERIKQRSFDLVVLDPPSFAKSRRGVPVAKRAYVKLNSSAMSVLHRGGLLLTASCSHHITEQTFQECIQRAARRAGRNLQQLAVLAQSPDHPFLPMMPETKYLKGGLYRVL
ncbi:MAG: class I SAM-dependent rRNA methyltransferase [Acidobacteria bacterium]|nr:class I SAM-dependent rRNA methyltransferase [Acidobacteriota bacterium]